MLLLLTFGFFTAYPVIVLCMILLFVNKERRRYARHHRAYQTVSADADGRKLITIGVFHPYADGGGGGERVLYCALASIVKKFKQLESQDKKVRLQLVLYTGDDGLIASELIEKSANRFNLPDLKTWKVDSFITIVKLPNRELLEPARYPRFTLLWQSLAHVRIASRAFKESEKMGLFPQYWIDTTGCPFSYLVASIRYGCSVIAYVHYPMISTDMIEKVQQRSADFNNDDAIAQSSTKSYVKYVYYRLFAGAYGLVGRFCTNVVMVNSTWTYNHIKRLWSKDTIIVYPPCGSMEEFRSFSLENRELVALSIAQFRPEKNHLLQLQAVQYLMTKYKHQMSTKYSSFKLILLGSCRNEDDEARVETLREQCEEMGLVSHVEFVVNASFDELKQRLSRSSIGLHTMYNEHFGISIVEMMAAGLVVVANNSGGPAADIVKPGTGYLALTIEEYGEAMFEILEQTASNQIELRRRARESAQRFSDQEFESQLLVAMEPAFPMWQHQ